MSEAAIKGALKKFLFAKGAHWFMPVQMGYGTASVDFLVCYRGRFIAIETKREGVDEISPRQKMTLAHVHAAGGWTIVENSPSLTRTRETLEQIDKILAWSERDDADDVQPAT